MSELKKKLNSGDKGHRAERAICKLFSDRFGQPFERSVGSGNRWSQVKGLSESSKANLVGDIVCPDGFRWVLESKWGYETKVDFYGLFTEGNKTLDSFLDQVSRDSERCGKRPMLLYKRNQRAWLAFVRTEFLPEDRSFDYRLVYREWSGVALHRLLESGEDYFFSNSPGIHWNQNII